MSGKVWEKNHPYPTPAQTSNGHVNHLGGEGNRDYFMVGECIRFLFTSCEESQTNE